MTQGEKKPLIVVVTRTSVPRGGERDEWCIEWGFERSENAEWREVTGGYLLFLHGCDELPLEKLVESAKAKAPEKVFDPTGKSHVRWSALHLFTHGLNNTEVESLKEKIASFLNSNNDIVCEIYGSGGSGGLAMDALAHEIRHSQIPEAAGIADGVLGIAEGSLAWIARFSNLRDWLLRLQCNVLTIQMAHDDPTQGKLADEAFEDLRELLGKRQQIQPSFSGLQFDKLQLPDSTRDAWETMHNFAVGEGGDFEAKDFWDAFLMPAPIDEAGSESRELAVDDLRTVSYNVNLTDFQGDLRKIARANDLLVDALQLSAAETSWQGGAAAENPDGETGKTA